MAEPLLDLQRLVADIRARHRLWVALALFGLLAGLLFGYMRAPGPTATTRVLVTHEQGGDPATQMATTIELFETTQVAGAALEELGLDASPTAFLGTYDGEEVTPDVLQITVIAPTSSEAERRAEVLADTFVTSHIRRVEQVAEAKAQALLDRQAELQVTAQEVSNTISDTIAAGAAAPPGSPEATEFAAQLDAQYSRRSGLSSQILDLQRQAEAVGLVSVDVAAGTQVIDPARAFVAAPLLPSAKGGVIGLVLGLGAGMGLAAVLSVVRDRPILRRDIAAHLGVSVIAQVPAVRRSPFGWWRRERNERARKRAAVTVAGVVGDAPRSASLLDIGCPRTVAELALAVAEEVTPAREVVIVDGLPTAALTRAAQRSGSTVTIVSRAAAAQAGNGSTADPTLSLGVASLTPGESWVDLAHLGSEAILVIRAGHPTTSWLHHVARLLADVGITPMGVVLVEPQPGDRSDGTLWDAAHLARRFRGSRRQQRAWTGDAARLEATSARD